MPPDKIRVGHICPQMVIQDSILAAFEPLHDYGEHQVDCRAIRSSRRTRPPVCCVWRPGGKDPGSPHTSCTVSSNEHGEDRGGADHAERARDHGEPPS